MAKLFDNNAFHPRRPDVNAWVIYNGCTRDGGERYPGVVYKFEYGCTINDGRSRNQ